MKISVFNTEVLELLFWYFSPLLKLFQLKFSGREYLLIIFNIRQHQAPERHNLRNDKKHFFLGMRNSSARSLYDKGR